MIPAETQHEVMEITCCELEEFAVHRDAGLTPKATALLMQIDIPTADQYERTLTNLLGTLALAAPPVLVAPSGCRWCGLEYREHFQRWTTAAGWHGWAEPTDVQRLTRMRARRAARKTTRNEATPSSARLEVAPLQAHTTPIEGATAP